MRYVNGFRGYITRGAFGRTRVLIVGEGPSEYKYPVRFSAWSRDKAIAKAQRWCRRQAHVEPDEVFEFDPRMP